MQHSKRDLEKIGFSFVSNLFYHEVAIHIPTWRGHGETEEYRAVKMNGTEWCVGRAAKGKFANGYSWMNRQYPIKGTGFRNIWKNILTSESWSRLWRAEHRGDLYRDMIASALDIARVVLKEMV